MPPNDDKLRELILLIAEWCQADPKFGAIKLNKLLFHADFFSVPDAWRVHHRTGNISSFRKGQHRAV